MCAYLHTYNIETLVNMQPHRYTDTGGQMQAIVFCSVTWCPYSAGAAHWSLGYRAMQSVARYSLISALKGSGYTEDNLGKLYITWCSSTHDSIRALWFATSALPCQLVTQEWALTRQSQLQRTFTLRQTIIALLPEATRHCTLIFVRSVLGHF